MVKLKGRSFLRQCPPAKPTKRGGGNNSLLPRVKAAIAWQDINLLIANQPIRTACFVFEGKHTAFQINWCYS